MSDRATVTCKDCGTPNVDPDWHSCGTKPLPGQPSLLDAGEVFAEQSGELPAQSGELPAESVQLLKENTELLDAYPGSAELWTAEPLTLTASVSRKVRITQYETAEVYVAVSNVTRDTTDADIQAMLEGPGAITWRRLIDAVNEKAMALRREWS